MKFALSVSVALVLAMSSSKVLAQVESDDQGPKGIGKYVGKPVKPVEGLPVAPKMEPGEKWVHMFGNFASEKMTAESLKIVKQAKEDGYTAIMISDVKWHKLQLTDESYKKSLQAFRKACKEMGIKFIAAGTGPFGYADTFLSHNPNLAEGQPVRGATFVVKDGQLVPFDDGSTKLVNGSFDELKDGQPAGWSGATVTVDAGADGAGKSICMDFGSGDSASAKSVSQDIKIKPWQYYLVSAKVKQENFKGKDVRFYVTTNIQRDGKPATYWLNMEMIDISGCKDWTTVYAAFCAQDATDATLKVGVWEPKGGKVWFDDVKITPGGFVNITRRDGTPLTVTSVDGKTTYTEGKDFGKVEDPKLVNDPRPGYFKPGHEQPTVKIPQGSSLKEGDKVLASYCFAIESGKAGQMNVCMSNDEVYKYIAEQIQWMKDNVQPDGYFMGYDEMRVGGWCDACVKSGKTQGQLLAESVAKTIALIKKIDPGKPISTWNDMFDPYHNASPEFKQYYMLKGSGPWAGSWEGLSSDVLIVNWLGKKPESVVYFAQRGNQQILSDQAADRIKTRLDAAKKLEGIIGVMFTNWSNDYSKMKEYADAVRAWDAANGKGGAKPDPKETKSDKPAGRAG